MVRRDCTALQHVLPIPNLECGDRSHWVQRLGMAWKSTFGWGIDREDPGQSLVSPPLFRQERSD